jgi:hypothetical protein
VAATPRDILRRVAIAQAFAQSRTHAILVRVFSAVTAGIEVNTAKTSEVVIEAIGNFREACPDECAPIAGRKATVH